MSAESGPPRPLDYPAPAELRPDAVAFGDSKVKTAVGLAGGVVLAVIGVALLRRPSGPWAVGGERAVFLIVCGGLIVVGAGLRLMRRKPRLVVDGAGLTDHATGLGLVPWPQIIAVRVVYDEPVRHPFLCLTVAEPAAIRSKRGPLSFRDRGLAALDGAGPDDVTVPLMGLTAKPDHVLAVVEQYRRGAGPGR